MSINFDEKNAPKSQKFNCHLDPNFGNLTSNGVNNGITLKKSSFKFINSKTFIRNECVKEIYSLISHTFTKGIYLLKNDFLKIRVVIGVVFRFSILVKTPLRHIHFLLLFKC